MANYADDLETLRQRLKSAQQNRDWRRASVLQNWLVEAEQDYYYSVVGAFPGELYHHHSKKYTQTQHTCE